jgi:hypothetical protein
MTIRIQSEGLKFRDVTVIPLCLCSRVWAPCPTELVIFSFALNAICVTHVLENKISSQFLSRSQHSSHMKFKRSLQQRVNMRNCIFHHDVSSEFRCHLYGFFHAK